MAEGKAGGVGSGRPVFDPNKMYNVTQEEMQALQERAKMREAMKQEFRKKASNPYRGAGGYIVSDLHLFGMTFDVCMYVFYSCMIDQQTLKLNVKLLYVRGWGILNRQSRAERQNTFEWLYILPVRVTISQYKSYSASGSHILPI